jgi:4'-phosphopantetheinyl transferase
MPLLLSKTINEHSAYAIWNIQETNDELIKIFNDEIPQEKLHQSKLAEWIVGRVLVRSLCAQFGIPFEGVTSLETGKPILKNGGAEISISHSFPMAAAMINLNSPCGIDLELPRHKLIQVRDKFVNGAEKIYLEDVHQLCVLWCAKEVLYKIHNRKALSLKDDTIIKILSSETATGTILKTANGKPMDYPIAIEEVKGFVLAYNT